MVSQQYPSGKTEIELEQDVKVLSEHAEVLDHGGVKADHDQHAWNIMPESLKGMSEEERLLLEKKMVRKMDLIILPIVMALYILNYIDRQNLAAAKLRGIMTDLHMNTTQFATAISILYAGYLPFQPVSNYIISKLSRPGLYICCAAMCWGAISAATAAATTYQALLGIRVLLGASEAVFFPGALYYLSAWYNKKELGKRYAALFIGQQLGNGFGGLIAAGVLTLDGVHGIAGWRWLFIVEGVATVATAFIFAFFLPEYPHNARMLTPVERELAVWRLEAEAGAGEAHEETSNLKAYTSALIDPKLYFLIVCILLSQAMGTVGNFFPTIVSSLGYTSTITLLLTAPPYLLACFVFYGMSYYSDKHNKLYWPIMACLATGMVIYIIAMTTLNKGARYFAFMWTPVANVVPQMFLYNTLSLHLPRPYPKRAAGLALMNTIGGTSNIWGSYVWYDAPRFFQGFAMVLCATALFAATITAYKFYILRENRKLEQGGEAAASAMRFGITQEQVSLGWRYVGY